MIGTLEGFVRRKQPPTLLLDVAGVGYELDAPMSTFYRLPEVGARARLHTQLLVRDELIVIYGFAELAERQLFRTLLRVSGVGPKLALTILSGMSVQGFAAALRAGDVDMLCRLPGVGKRTAERLVVELRDRLGAGEPVTPGEAVPGDEAAAAASPEAEAVSALIALGFKPAEAERSVRQALKELGAADTDRLIRAALQGTLNG